MSSPSYLQNSLIASNTHVCKAFKAKQAKINYCFECSTCMANSSFTEEPIHFYRPIKYNLVNVYKLEPTLILKKMVTKQAKNRYFNKNAYHLDYRVNLVAFVQQLCNRLNYSMKTFYLSCSILDAVLSLYFIEQSQIKMLTVICVQLSAKMNENLDSIPELTAISKKFENEFTCDELMNCEAMVFKILDYNLNIVTSYDFITQFLYRGVVSSLDLKIGITAEERATVMNSFENLVFTLLEVTLKNYQFYKYSSIAVAATVIGCVRKFMGFGEIWNESLESLTFVSYKSIKSCIAYLEKSVSVVYPEFGEVTMTEYLRPVQKEGQESPLMELEDESKSFANSETMVEIPSPVKAEAELEESKYCNDGKENFS